MPISDRDIDAGGSTISVDPSSAWLTRDGKIPFLDDPTLSITAHRWDKPPIINMKATQMRLATGQIGGADLSLSNLLVSWRCVTEKQLRTLALPYFDKGHKVGTRLRLLQKIGWFDGLQLDTVDGRREHIWYLGISAFQYYTFVKGVPGLLDPTWMSRFSDYVLSVSAINDFRSHLESRGHCPEVTYGGIWRKGEEAKPFSRFDLKTSIGPLTLYVERLARKANPVGQMRKKCELYDRYVKEQGALPSKDSGVSMVIWSVGSLQAVEQIVSSMDYIPDTFVQAFMVDEDMESFPHCFYLAKKGSRHNVEIQPLAMDML